MRGRFFRRIALLFAAMLVFIVGGATLLFWLVASALGAVEISETALRGALLLMFVILVIGVAAAARGVRRLAEPLGDVIEAAGRVEAGDLSVRLVERGPREVRGLARAFNAMSAHLEASEELRRRLLADVTHELRTPLTVMQGNLEALLDGVYPADATHLQPVLDETRVLSRLVDDLRTLSLAEAGALTLHRESTDVAALARETVAAFQTQAADAGVTLLAEAAPAAPLADIDPVRIREVLANLVANALHFTPRGGSVRVKVADEHGVISVLVRDSGAGIAADALPHVFERFYKSAGSGGAGLGLAIARSLVLAHGGEISARSEPGQGTEMRFTLSAGA